MRTCVHACARFPLALEFLFPTSSPDLWETNDSSKNLLSVAIWSRLARLNLGFNSISKLQSKSSKVQQRALGHDIMLVIFRLVSKLLCNVLAGTALHIALDRLLGAPGTLQAGPRLGISCYSLRRGVLKDTLFQIP